MVRESSAALLGMGGQGVVYAVTTLANALFKSGYYVSQLQSYGAEVRGGSVLAYVVFSKEPIENPFIDSFNYIAVLHPAGLKRWGRLVEGSKVVIVNEDLIPKELIKDSWIKIPLTKLAPTRESMAALGCLAALGVVDLSNLINALPYSKFKEDNEKAIRKGYEAIKPQNKQVIRKLRDSRPNKYSEQQ